MSKPIVAITMGDPAGIGPEIIVKTLNNPEIYSYCKPLIIGESGVLEQAQQICGTNAEVRSISSPSDGLYSSGTIDVIDIPVIGNRKIVKGEVNGECGKAAFAYIKKAVELALSGEVLSMSTGPINKESFRAGGVDFIGHTEVLGSLSGVDDPLTMFEVRDLRVFFLSRHVPLKEASDLVTKERVLDYIRRCSAAMKQLGLEGDLAIAGFNPHCGEHGLFGDEEGRAIEPAIEEALKEGYRVKGPIGADSVFHQALNGKYKAVLSLYHDQGHIATKTLDFNRTISLTLGLPFLRTSVDHGTAFDIAGKGIAQEISMMESIRLAAKYAVIIRDR